MSHWICGVLLSSNISAYHYKGEPKLPRGKISLHPTSTVYQDMVYYPKFAVDCFALLKEIVGSYLEQTEVLEQ